MPPPEIGSVAPDFTLPGVAFDGVDARHRHYSLREHLGSPIVLAFYPSDSTPGCTAQLCSYQGELGEFELLGARVWAINRQSTSSHESFARRQGLEFPMLADERSDVVDAYGVGLLGVGVRRSVFVIDALGVIRWKHVALLGLSFPSPATIREQLARLGDTEPHNASAAS